MPLHQRRDQFFRNALSLLATLVLLLHIRSSAYAADRELVRQRSQLDVVLLFDASGSMLKTDAQNLRYEGAKLLLSFLGEGDRLGIVQFAGSAKVVQEMQPFTEASSKEATLLIQSIVASGEFTDIAEGVKVSKTLLEARPRSEAQRVIVLLSDGKVEPDPSVSPAFARTLELVHDILPDLKSKEIKVFTLAFSEGADQNFLGEVAAATDGLSWFTKTAEDLHKSFAELFLAVKRPQVVAQTGKGFNVDGDVEEATFYINHEPEEVLTLITPRGVFMTSEKHPERVTWFTGKRFDVITISGPDPGVWQVSGTEERDGFATVLTDLKLLTDWPLVVRANDEPLVQARLYEETKPISLPEMNGVLKFGFQVIPTDKVSKPIVQEPLNDDGIDGDKVALDGIFSRLTQALQEGSYKLVVAAKGPTFQRSQQIPFTVRPRLVNLDVQRKLHAFDETEESHDTQAEQASRDEKAGEGSQSRPTAEISGDDRTEFIVELSKEASSFKKIRVELIALSAERERLVIEMKPAGNVSHQFRAKAEELPKSGVYKLKAIMRADAQKGQEVEAESQSVSFKLAATSQRHSAADSAKHQGADKSEAAPKKPITSGLPIIPLLIVSLCNAAALGMAYLTFKRLPKTVAATASKYYPQKQLLEALAALEERVSASSLELDSPILRAALARGNESGDGQVEEQQSSSVGGDADQQPAQSDEPATGSGSDG